MLKSLFPLSRSQRAVLWVAGLLILATCSYPQYTTTWPCYGNCDNLGVSKGQIHTVTRGYWIWDRPISELTVEARLSPFLFVQILSVAVAAGLTLVAIAQRKRRKDTAHGQPEPDKPVC